MPTDGGIRGWCDRLDVYNWLVWSGHDVCNSGSSFLPMQFTLDQSWLQNLITLCTRSYRNHIQRKSDVFCYNDNDDSKWCGVFDKLVWKQPRCSIVSLSNFSFIRSSTTKSNCNDWPLYNVIVFFRLQLLFLERWRDSRVVYAWGGGGSWGHICGPVVVNFL